MWSGATTATKKFGRARWRTGWALLGDVSNNYFFHFRKLRKFIENMIVFVTTSGGLFARIAKAMPSDVATI